MSLREEDVGHIATSPFSVITIAASLTQTHDPSMTTQEWMTANISLIEEIGAEQWITHVLDVLEGKSVSDKPVSPFHVVNIDPIFAQPHEPIVPREVWIGANTKLIQNEGAHKWLTWFLETLEGDLTMAKDLGLFPGVSDAPFGYRAIGESNSARRQQFLQRGKKKGKKKRNR